MATTVAAKWLLQSRVAGTVKHWTPAGYLCEDRRVRFSIRDLLLLTTAAAFAVAAAAVLPTLHGTLILLLAALIAPAALATAAMTGGSDAKVFCLSAIVPIAFALYCLGWAMGWAVYQVTEPNDLSSWIGDHGRTIKALLLASWACGALAGITCVGIRRMHAARSRAGDSPRS